MAVTMPVTATTVRATVEASKIGCARTTRYTPAVTMVAAWMRADTGVGPSMASGSHTCNGSWADLPTAPANSSRAITVAVPLASPSAPSNTTSKSSEPKWTQMKMIPMSMAESPIRVVTKAFFAASAAVLRSNQNPISR
jgi:hypothetical protein